MHNPAAAAPAPTTSSSVSLRWVQVQVLKPDSLLLFDGFWFMHCVVARLASFLRLASFCDFGSDKLKAHLRLAVTAQIQ